MTSLARLAPTYRIIGRIALKITALMLALAAGLVPSLASAADANRIEVSREVKFNDLDLTSTEGQQSLDARISLAVRSVCGRPNGRVLAEVMQYGRCRREAIASATIGRQFAMAQSARRTATAMAMTSRDLGKPDFSK
jgi:UrcA family protein